MDAVAARAVGRQRRAVLRRQPVVALKESLNAVRWQVVLRVHPLRGVALAADLDRNLQGGAALEGLDLMLRMAIGAGRRLAMAGGHGLAMHALFHVFGYLVVARAAGLGQAGEMQRRSRGRGRHDGVPVVTVTAGRGILSPLCQRQAVDAGPVALRLRFVALLAVGRLGGDVVVGVLDGDVGVAARAGIGLVDRERDLGDIDEEGDLFAGGIGLGQRLIRVAIEAGAVLNWFGGGHNRQRPVKGKKGCG